MVLSLSLFSFLINEINALQFSLINFLREGEERKKVLKNALMENGVHREP